jgi:hypothetical protein
VLNGIARLCDKVSVIVQLQLEDGNMFAWTLGSPVKVLQTHRLESTSFRNLFEALMAKSPSTQQNPWNLVLYHDELTPGNVLKPMNGRKICCMYFSWLEFGEHLRSEHCWLFLGCLRHSMIAKVKGGFSNVFRKLLLSMFLSSAGFQPHGDLLQLRSNILHFTRLANVLSDESALKQSWDAKGSAGLKPCMLCKNCCSKGMDQVDPTRYLVSISCSRFTQFEPATDADIWERLDTLRQHRGTKASLQELEKAMGLNRNLDGVLACQELRPHLRPTSSTYDSMHCWFSHGVATNELHLFLQAVMANLTLTWRQFAEYASAEWKVKKQSIYLAPSVFVAGRQNSDGLKAMASEVLCVMPIIRHLMETVIAPSGKLNKEVASFRAMCECASLLRQLKRTPSKALCQDLQLAQTRHLDLFLAAYPESEIKPKHHYSLHIPGQVIRDGMLLDTFVLERKHRTMKRHASEIDNTSVHFEATIFARALIDQLKSMPITFENHLVPPSTSSQEIANVRGFTDAEISESMSFGTTILSVTDIIVHGDKALQIVSCVHADSAFWLLVKVYKFLHVSGAGKLWAPTVEIALFSPAEQSFIEPTHWTFQSDGKLLTL